MKKYFYKNKEGFSIIEVMVAFIILSISFIGLMQSFPFGLSVNKDAENETVSSYLVQEKIEELISLGYGEIDTGIVEEKHRLSEDAFNFLYNFQRETEVYYVDEDLANSISDLGIKKIAVTVYFPNAISKEEKSYNITTLISER